MEDFNGEWSQMVQTMLTGVSEVGMMLKKDQEDHDSKAQGEKDKHDNRVKILNDLDEIFNSGMVSYLSNRLEDSGDDLNKIPSLIKALEPFKNLKKHTKSMEIDEKRRVYDELKNNSDELVVCLSKIQEEMWKLFYTLDIEGANYFIQMSNSGMFQKSVCELRGADGRTLLHLAIQGGNVAVIQAVIKAGVDVNQCDKDGSAPLHYASNFNNLPAIKFLLEQGANPCVRNNYNKYPDQIAEGGKAELILHIARCIKERSVSTQISPTKKEKGTAAKETTLEIKELSGNANTVGQKKVEAERSNKSSKSKFFKAELNINIEREALEALLKNILDNQPLTSLSDVRYRSVFKVAGIVELANCAEKLFSATKKHSLN